MLNIVEAADKLGISPRTLYDWVRHRKIPFYRVGEKNVRFKEEELEEWLQAHREEAIK